MTSAILVRKLLRHHWKMALLLASLTASITTPLVALEIVTATTRAAIEQSADSSMGGYRYALQVVDKAAVNPVFAHRDDLVFVRDEPGEVASDDAAVDVTVRTVRDPGVALGVLVEGVWPSASDEVVISRAVSEALDSGVGDDVTLSSIRRATVVGIAASPADRAERSAFGFDAGLTLDAATILLTNSEVLRDPEVRSLGDRRLFTLRTAALATDQSGVVSTSLIMRGLSVPWPVGAVILLAVVLPVMGLLAVRSRSDIDSMVAAGMDRTRAGRVFGLAALLSVFCAVVLATGAAVLVVSTMSSEIASVVGQDWLSVSLPVRSMAGLVTLSLAGVALAGVGLPSLGLGQVGVLRWRPRVRRTRAGVLAGAWILVVGLWMLGVVPWIVAAAWGGVTSCLFPAAVGYPRRLDGSAAARRRVVQAVSRSMLPVVLPSVLIVWLATSVSADAIHESQSAVSMSGMPQPAGSLLAYEIPRDAAASAISEYRRLGGAEVVEYMLPAESAARVRAASATLVRCMQEAGTRNVMSVPPECVPMDSVSPMNLIALTGGSDGVVADPTLISDGGIGVITFSGDSPDATGLGSVAARPDPLLGGNMPGAVVGAGSAFAVEHGLAASDSRLVAFLDFSELSVRDQARFRAALSRIAPAAQTADEGEFYARASGFRVFGRVVAVGGGVLGALLVAFGGGAVVAAASVTRRNILDLSQVASERRRLARRLLWTPLLATAFAAVAGLGSAWISGVHDGSGFGVVWLLVPVLVAVTWVLVVRAFMSDAAAGRV